MTYDPGTNTVHDNDIDRRALQATTIRTVSGRYIDVLDPDPADIHIGDIAHGLAMVCRYGGHVAAHYSVGEHSLNVAAQLHRMYGEPRLTLAGLLHDGSEAYIGDVVRPLKHDPQMSQYRVVEALFEERIAERFGVLVESKDPRVKQVDNEVLPWEMAMIRDSTVRIAPDPLTVRDAFLARFCHLSRS